VLILTSLLVSSSTSKNDRKVLDFVENAMKKNPNITFKKAVIKNKHTVDGKWKAYVLKVDAVFRGKDISFGETMFSNGNLIARDFIDLKTYSSIKENFSSLFSKSFYNKANLISGSSKSKNKIAVFSDPMCPYCQDLLPKLVSHSKKNPKDIALYYYHFPLTSIHPSVEVVSRAMIVATKRGIKDVVAKIYKVNLDSELNDKQALAKVNKALKLSGNKKITMSDIEKSNIIKAEERDKDIARELLLNGTPVVYINEIKDNTRVKYLSIGNK